MPLAHAGAVSDAAMPEWCSASMSGAAGDGAAPAARAGGGDLGWPAGSGHHCVMCAAGEMSALPSLVQGDRSVAISTDFLVGPASPLDAGLALRPWLARAPPR
jgi:hypothetical protein